MRVVDLFSGIGGLTLGFQNLGFDVVAAFDHWGKVNDVYKDNFTHPVHTEDLSDPNVNSLISKYNPDVLVGGPPCQDFSQAGKRNEDGKNGHLTISFAEIVSNVKPKYFVMENVDGLIMTQKYKKAFHIFKNNNYGITVELLDASYFGVPQRRKRYFVIGILNGKDEDFAFLLKRGKLTNPMTVRNYFETFDVEYYYRHPRSYQRRGIFSIDEPSPTIRGVNRPIPPNYQVHKNDAIKDLSKVRPLTTRERLLIQTFPRDFVLEGTKTNKEQMVGNAVPVKLAEHVAEAIRDHVKSF